LACPALSAVWLGLPCPVGPSCTLLFPSGPQPWPKLHTAVPKWTPALAHCMQEYAGLPAAKRLPWLVHAGERGDLAPVNRMSGQSVHWRLSGQSVHWRLSGLSVHWCLSGQSVHWRVFLISACILRHLA